MSFQLKPIFAKYERGFTLVEVLIALFIFSLISVGATSALTSSLRGKVQMEERLTEVSELGSLRALVKSDMANLVLRQRREPYGNLEPYVLQSGGETLLSFVRAGRTNPAGLSPRGDLQHVGYLFENGQLIRRSYSQVNPAPQSGHVDRILMTGLEEARLRLMVFDKSLLRDAYLEGFALQQGTSSAETGAIEITLKRDNGDTLTQLFELGL